MQTGSLQIISSNLSMRSNQVNIPVVTCAPSGADPCARAVVANRVQLRRAANFALNPEISHISIRRPSTFPRTKHAHAKRAQPKNMVRPTSLAPRRPLTQTLRQLKVPATRPSRRVVQRVECIRCRRRRRHRRDGDRSRGTSCRKPGCVLEARYGRHPSAGLTWSLMWTTYACMSQGRSRGCLGWSRG